MRLLLILNIFISFLSYGGELEKLIEYALEHSPRLQTYRYMSDTIKYREGYLKTLPNPSLSIGLNNLPLNRPYPNRYEPMSNLSLGLSQMYVLPVKREREALLARAEVELLKARLKLAEKELIRDLKLRYLEWLYTFKREELLKNILAEIRALEKLSEENYKLGRASLSELLSVRAEAIRVERDIRKVLEERRLIKEEIDSLLGKSFDLKGEEVEVGRISIDNLKPEETSFIKPMLAEREMLRAQVERLRVEYLPDIELMAEYMVRPGLENMVSFRMSVSLPMRRSRREDLMVLEKLWELKAKEWEIESIKLSLKKEMNSLRIEMDRAIALKDLTERLSREKKGELRALELAYKYGKADFRDLIRLYRELWELRMSLLELELEIKTLNLKAEVYL